MVEIRNVEDKKEWQAFLSQKEVSFYPFFQSWLWGEVQGHLGHEVSSIGVYENKKLVAVCQIVDVPAKRGHYLHLRHGPVLLPFNKEVFQAVIAYITDIAKKKGASFIRLSPVVQKEFVDFPNLAKMGLRDAPMHNMDAEICWVLDITKTEEELLKEMRKTHRYLIKKARGMDIKITKTQKSEDIESFLALYKDLSHRKHFVPHGGVKEEFTVFAKEDEAMLLLAIYDGKIISGAFIAFVGNMAIYRHGASDASFRDVPASYLLQWEGILEAKKRGKTLYNFWGITPSDSPKHPWKGLTLFKTGFGGKRVELLHAQDLPLNLSYWKTYAIEAYTKWKKGY